MSNRSYWPKKFFNALSEIEHEETWQYAYYMVKSWLIESLEPKQRRVYEYVSEFSCELDTSQVSNELGLSYNHAATILKTLCDLKLLKRRSLTKGNIRFYVYWKP